VLRLLGLARHPGVRRERPREVPVLDSLVLLPARGVVVDRLARGDAEGVAVDEREGESRAPALVEGDARLDQHVAVRLRRRGIEEPDDALADRDPDDSLLAAREVAG